MKSPLSALTLGLIITSSNAFATTDYNAVLKDPTVVAVSKLMSDKYAGSCKVPQTESDVFFTCMGALPLVTKPTPASVGCVFETYVKCSGETALIRGSQNMWVVVFPFNSNPPPSDTAEGGIQIWEVSFSKTP